MKVKFAFSTIVPQMQVRDVPEPLPPLWETIVFQKGEIVAVPDLSMAGGTCSYRRITSQLQDDGMGGALYVELEAPTRTEDQ